MQRLNAQITKRDTSGAINEHCLFLMKNRTINCLDVILFVKKGRMIFCLHPQVKFGPPNRKP